ncbi:MAG: carboxypeptidase regulatory-like domain-containing protein [Planctomycetes bacterium]|nr:carboxypeptidase regulatory-like domain-containing protein [Planctomycetota bacterium]MCB9936472.1 carboxypeptidase regulatory-like domain-containing protein [Planctomycetota bacterium]
MKSSIALLAVLLGLALPLAAGEFKTTATGYIRSARYVGLEGAVASVQADPLWGCDNEEAFKAFEKLHGALPTVTVTGSGLTNSKGRFLFNVTVSWDDKGTIPKRTYRNKEGQDVEYISVPVIFKATAKGFSTGTQKGRANEGFESTADFSLTEATVLKGGVVLAEGRKFLPDLKLLLVYRSYNQTGLVDDIRYEFSTGKDGFFEISDENLPKNSVTLQVAGNEYAFEPGSKAWQSITLRPGVLDLGILAVVPGGRVKFNAVDSENSKSVGIYYGQLQSTDKSNRFQAGFVSDATGAADIEGVPAGQYQLHLRLEGHWAPEVAPIELKAGTTVELGAIQCEPHRTLEFAVRNQDGALDRFNVQMVYVGDAVPPARRPFREGEPIRAGGQLSSKESKINGLFSGEWQVTISAPNHAHYMTTVTLPRNEPLSVTMEKAGTIEFTALDAGGRAARPRWAFALRHGSTAHKQMADLDDEGLGKFTGWEAVLPEGAYRMSNGNKFENLAAGTYLLLAEGGWKMVLRADDVTLKTGETVKVTLSPKPGTLTVKVTEDGKPKAKYSFILRLDGRDQQPISLTTDKAGAAIHDFTVAASGWLLTEAESEWVDAHDPNEPWRALNDTIFAGRRVQLQVARDSEIGFEIANPEQVFVRLRLTPQEGQTVQRVDLSPLGDGRFSSRRSFQAAKLGEDFCVACMPQGKYRMGALVQAGASSGYFAADITVDKKPEQSIKLKIELFRLDVTFKVAAGVKIDNIGVYLRYAEVRRSWPDDEPDLLTPDADGSISFQCLSPADYQLYVRVYDDDGVLQNALMKAVTVKGNTTLTVPVTDQVGTLSVQIEGQPLRSTLGMSSWPAVYLLDAKGEAIQPGDPTLLEEVRGFNFSIPGLPVGTFTVVIAAPGFQACEIKDVKIEQGKTTSVKATPQQAGALVLNINNLPFDMETEINWSYEDAKGNPLKLWLPAGSSTVAIMGDRNGNGAKMEFSNMTPAVKQVRIKIEGYKDIVVKVDVKAGEIITKDAKGTKK